MFSGPEQTEYILSQLTKREQTLTDKLKKAIKVDSSGSESDIFVNQSLKELYKVPKIDYSDSLIRSYYIGRSLNKLSTLVPNFVHTKQIHVQDDMFVSYDLVEGDTWESKLNTLSFSQFIHIFVTVLFALELAQRYCSFCHYDLHLENILLVQEKVDYTLVFDGYCYQIHSEWIPVLIDFGFSSAVIKDKAFGCESFEHCGIYPFPLPGMDMYKLLFHAYAKADEKLQTKIGNLFLFYGSYDPYKILISSKKDLVSYSKQYLRNVSTSHIAGYTPLEFAKWILERYPSKYINIRPRDLFRPIRHKKSLTLPEIDTKSYILNSYIKNMFGIDTNLDEQYVQFDCELLSKYTRIRVPNELTVRDECNLILSQITFPKKVKHIQTATKFILDMSPYVQYLYTIRETKLAEKYNKFVNSFTCSKQFKMFNQLEFIVTKTNRWLQSLKLRKQLQLN